MKVLNVLDRDRGTGNVIDIMFNDYRRRVLSLLLLHPQQCYHVREISRVAGVPAGSVHRELKVLAHAGLLDWEMLGNQVRYRANTSCPIFEELASIFTKTSGLGDVIRDALIPLSDEIDIAFIFGSVAQRKEHARSDVDVFVIGDVSLRRVIVALANPAECVRRDINPLVMPWNRFYDKLALNDHFLQRVMDEPKIYLIGDSGDPRLRQFDRFSENREFEKSRNK